MIIERWEHRIKPGRLEEAINLLYSVDWGRPFKLLESEVGLLYRLSADVEWGSMAEMESGWNEIGSNTEYENFLQKWRPLVVSSERKIFKLIEASQ